MGLKQDSVGVNRAFSAGTFLHGCPGALPQAKMKARRWRWRDARVNRLLALLWQ
jgi:hypothetical protein